MSPARTWVALRDLLPVLPHGDRKVWAARLGVHPTTFSKWTTGVQVPRPATVARLLTILGIDARQLGDPEYTAALRRDLARREVRIRLSRREFQDLRQIPLTSELLGLLRQIRAAVPGSWL